MLPGNDLYYLSKLGRLELLGIPQIYYEPLYCNNNFDKLIPNVYDDALYIGDGTDDDRSVVENAANTKTFTYSPNRFGTGRSLEMLYDEDIIAPAATDESKQGSDGYITYADGINHEAIFFFS